MEMVSRRGGNDRNHRLGRNGLWQAGGCFDAPAGAGGFPGGVSFSRGGRLGIAFRRLGMAILVVMVAEGGMVLEQWEAAKPRIAALIEQRQWKEIAATLRDWPDPEVADLLLLADKPERVLLFRALPRERAANVFSYLDLEHQGAFVEDLTDEDTRQLLSNLSPDDRTALLAELPAEVTQRLFELLDAAHLSQARQLLGYPEESVGRLMTPNYISVQRDWSIQESFAHMRRVGRSKETFNFIYVTDERGRLLDALRLRRFVMADPTSKVEQLMNHRFFALSAFDDREKAVEIAKRYDLNVLPVLDSEGVLIGIVTIDDLFDVAEEEATEDFHRSAGVAPLEGSYRLASPVFLFQRRFGWLTILIFVNLISGWVISSYEEYLQEFLVLAFFMPLLIATGGNTGAQSATLMIRALATGDVRLGIGALRSAFGKEVLVGLMLAFWMGLLTYGLGFLRGSGTLDIALVVSVSMVAIVLVANLIGVLMPFLLSMLKWDPAVASSPLITSLMDAVGLLIYFGVAAWILQL